MLCFAYLMPLEPINVLSMSRILLLVSVIIVNAKKDIVLRTSEVCYSILRYATASLKYCKQSNAPDAKASSYSPAFFSNILLNSVTLDYNFFLL